LYNALKEQREKTVQKLLMADGTSLRGDREVDASIRAYGEAKMKAEGNPQVQAFLGQDQTGENVRTMEGLTCEFIFYDNVVSEMPRDDELDSQLEFYQKLKSLHKDVFGKDLDIARRVETLTNRSFERAPSNQRSNAATDLRGTGRQPQQSTRGRYPDPEVNSVDLDDGGNDYDYDMRSKSPNMDTRQGRNESPEHRNDMKFTLGLEDGGVNNEFPEPHIYAPPVNESSYGRSQQSSHRPAPMIPETRPSKTISQAKMQELKKENDRLKTDINELSLIREDLEQKIENSFVNQSRVSSSVVITNLKASPQTQALLERKNQKEMEIDDLKRKIQRLENEGREDPFEESDRRAKPVDLSDRKQHRTRSQVFLEKDLTERSRVLRPPKKTFVKVAEKSGSTFVNQMMNDISRVLTRGGGNAGLSPNVSMTRSYYLNQ